MQKYPNHLINILKNLRDQTILPRFMSERLFILVFFFLRKNDWLIDWSLEGRGHVASHSWDTIMAAGNLHKEAWVLLQIWVGSYRNIPEILKLLRPKYRRNLGPRSNKKCTLWGLLFLYRLFMGVPSPISRCVRSFVMKPICYHARIDKHWNLIFKFNFKTLSNHLSEHKRQPNRGSLGCHVWN